MPPIMTVVKTHFSIRVILPTSVPSFRFTGGESGMFSFRVAEVWDIGLYEVD